jgi:hypothetical protein
VISQKGLGESGEPLPTREPLFLGRASRRRTVLPEGQVGVVKIVLGFFGKYPILPKREAPFQTKTQKPVSAIYRKTCL